VGRKKGDAGQNSHTRVGKAIGRRSRLSGVNKKKDERQMLQRGPKNVGKIKESGGEDKDGKKAGIVGGTKAMGETNTPQETEAKNHVDVRVSQNSGRNNEEKQGRHATQFKGRQMARHPERVKTKRPGGRLTSLTTPKTPTSKGGRSQGGLSKTQGTDKLHKDRGRRKVRALRGRKKKRGEGGLLL